MTLNPFAVVPAFEEEVAKYAGCKYGIAVDSCTAALFLSLKFHRVAGSEITIPARTYVSVPCEIIHAGAKVKFVDYDWSGAYQLEPYPIWDSAKRFRADMFPKNEPEDTCWCVSFHHAKILSIGRGGMILTNSADVNEWAKCARFSGRHEQVPLKEDKFNMIGWHKIMEPIFALKGLHALLYLPRDNPDQTEDFQDLSRYEMFTNANR